MGISIERAQRHVAENCAALRGFVRNVNWPKCLFHAAHVETAVKIMRAGCITPRSQLGIVEHDVANQGALGNNPAAHRYSRLYFRPKNGFHLRTEGIKCLTDAYRLPCQMSVPIMFAFDAVSVLSLPLTGFTDRNFAHQYMVPGHDEDYFNTIPFQNVYHDQPTYGALGEQIRDHRMAEVVYPDCLPLQGNLRLVVCRTSVDRDTLLFLLGDMAEHYRNIITVEQYAQSTFFHDGLYIKNIGYSNGQLNVEFKIPRTPPNNGKYKVRIERMIWGDMKTIGEGEIVSVPNRFTLKVDGADDYSVFRIFLEDVLAFHGYVSMFDSQIF